MPKSEQRWTVLWIFVPRRKISRCFYVQFHFVKPKAHFYFHANIFISFTKTKKKHKPMHSTTIHFDFIEIVVDWK